MRWRSLLFVPAIVYQALVIVAGVRHLYSRRTASRAPTSSHFSVSVLKPVRGLDPNTEQAFVSQIEQDIPEFEVLFGVCEGSDPAVGVIQRLQRDFPHVDIRLIVSNQRAPNGKVGILIDLAAQAKYPIWVVNDSDIRVTPEYLKTITQPLMNSSIGVVTCPYRVKPHTIPAIWEALGISVDFMPSTLVAPLFGVSEFGFGSTLAFRAEDLKRVGGFAALADYLADDYQLAKRITGLGKEALLSTYTVETALNDASWGGVWQHQLRWARTIRMSKGAGYAGLPITQAGIWALLAMGVGARKCLTLLTVMRVLSSFITGGLALDSPIARRLCWLAPVWDLYAFAVWAASYLGQTVRWRDRQLQIDSEGRIQ